MTNQEAIKFAKCLKNNYTVNLNDMEKFCDLTIQALGKQIPKKPIRIHEKGQLYRWDKMLCPNCNQSAETNCGDPFENYGLDFCEHCGQAIDWGEE